jgi:hypothetical protein
MYISRMPEIPPTGHFTTKYHTKSIERLIDKVWLLKTPSHEPHKNKSRSNEEVPLRKQR